MLVDMIESNLDKSKDLANPKPQTMYKNNLQKTKILNKEFESERQEELEIVKNVLNGNRDAFRLLFDIHYPKILSAAKRIFGNSDQASDLAQDTFLKAYKNLSSFKGDSSFYTWVYKILVNTCIDARRKSSYKYEVATSEDYLLNSSNNDPLVSPFHSHQWSQEDAVYASQLRNYISSSLDALSKPHRDVILMREVEGLSYEDISKLLNCSLGTVMSRLFHARKNLISILNSKLKIEDETINVKRQSLI